MTLPNQAAGLATVGLEFAFSSGDSGVAGMLDSIPGAVNRTQSAITEILKGQMQESSGWNAAHQAGYGELLPGIPFVPNIVFQMADMMLDMTPLGPFLNLSDIADFISSGTSIFGSLIPGIDASKIISGTLGAGIIQPLIDAISEGFGGGFGFDFGDLTDFLAGLTFGGANWDELFGGITGQTGGLDELIDLFTGGLFGNISPGRISFVPTGAIGTDSANLFANPGFDGAISMQELYGWTHDDTFGHTSVGSAMVVADGNEHTLFTNPVAVDVNQTIPMGIWVHYTGLTATAGQNALQFAVQAYEGTGAGASFISETMLAGILSPSGSSSNPGENNFIHLEATYTVPAGVDEIRGVAKVKPAATAGTVHYDDAHAQTTRLLPIPFIDGLPTQLSSIIGDIADRVLTGDFNGLLTALFGGTSVGSTILSAAIPALAKSKITGLLTDLADLTTYDNTLTETIFTALGGGDITGLNPFDAITSVLQDIPSIFVSGWGGPGNAADTWQATWDQWIGGLVGALGTGSSLADLFNIGQIVSSQSWLGSQAFDITGIQNNKGIFRGAFPTGRSNIRRENTMFAATTPVVLTTPTAALTSWEFVEQAIDVGFVAWEGFYNTGAAPTDFRVNIWKMTAAGDISCVHHSASSQLGLLTATTSTDAIYSFSDTPVHFEAGDIIGVQWHPVGNNYNIVGGTSNKNTNHPLAIPRRPSSKMNLGATVTTPGPVASASVDYNTVLIPVFEYGVSTAGVPLPHSPTNVEPRTTAGTSTFPIPDWVNTIYPVVIPAGGKAADNFTSTLGIYGDGGNAGTIGTGTWTRGVHFNAGDSVTITTVNGSTSTPAGNCVASLPGGASISRAAGTNGSGLGGSAAAVGASPGSATLPDGYVVNGGAAQEAGGGAGNPPGGGGAGGTYLAAGGNGARSTVILRLRQ